MKKIYGNILNANLIEMTNNETGVVTTMTKILYTTEIDSSDKQIGTGILECYVKGDKLSILEKFTKLVELNVKKYRPLHESELEEKFIKTGTKLYVSKIGDVSLN